MKKYLTYLLLFVYVLFPNVCFANVSNLYFIRNTNKNTLQPIVEKYLLNSKYEIVKRNPYLAVYKKNASNYVIIILQNSSANMFYYFNSTDNKSINSSIIKELKKQNVSFEQSFNQSYLSTFENQANKILTNTENNSYTFTDNTAVTTTVKSSNTASNKVLKGYVGQIPKGTMFKSYLQTPVNTATANVGDSIIAILTDDWMYNGSVIAPQGSVLSGTIVKAQSARYGSRNGSVDIDFNTLQTGKKTYNISTEKIEFDVSNDGKIGKVSKNVLAGAATGALLGLLIGLCNSKTSNGAATAIGAGIGAGSAIIGSAVEKGVDAEIPTYTELDITLSKPMNIVISY